MITNEENSAALRIIHRAEDTGDMKTMVTASESLHEMEARGVEFNRLVDGAWQRMTARIERLRTGT